MPEYLIPKPQTYQNQNISHTYTNIRSLVRHTGRLKYIFDMVLHFDLIVLWYPNCYLVSPFFMHSEYKKIILTFAFTTTVLLSLNCLKFANKNKILQFRNFHWLTKITHILDGGVYLERHKRVFNISTLVSSP